MATTFSRRSLLLAGGATMLAAALPALSWAQTSAPVRNRALFQVTENDPARWNIILNNMQNLRDGVGGEPVEIELVAYGPGIVLLKAESPMKQRIVDAVKAGVKVSVCENTMNAVKLTPPEMLPEAGYVPSGVVQVMRRQQQGWAYIRS